MFKNNKKKAITGQEEIYNALVNKKVLKLWKLVQYVGYNIIPSPQFRKLVFLKAYKDFNVNRNNNFIAFYNQYLRYMSLNSYKFKTQILTSDRKAITSHLNNYYWPTSNKNKPVNQNENILNHFCL